MDRRDVALQVVMPTVMVPRYTDLEELSEPGNRILMASNGTWLEVCRAWLYARIPVGPALKVPVPYGEISMTVRFAFGKLPRIMVDQFIELARVRSPNECAAWIIWNEVTEEWRLQMLDETSVGPGHVDTTLPILDESEHMVLDLHSHGVSEAFFSRTDNKDDRGECKVAGVVGNLNKGEVSTVFRLCANGMFLTIPFF